MRDVLRRALCLLLAALLLCLSLSGCGLSSETLGELVGENVYASEEPTAEREPVTAGAPALTDTLWFGVSPYRADLSYEDMGYYVSAEPYLDEYIDELLKFRNGGEYEDFIEAYLNADDELCRLYTRYTMADIDYSADPTEENAAISDEAYAAWMDGWDDFFDAMGRLALTDEGSALIDELFGEGANEVFSGYEDGGSGSGEGTMAEQSLLKEYDRILTSENPDLARAADIFAELVALRNDEAFGMGYSSYADYSYVDVYYRNFWPVEVADTIWPSVKTYLVPVYEQFAQASADALWRLLDSDMDCSEERVLEALEYVAPRLSSEAAEALDYMLGYGLYDISQSPTKLDTGFTVTLFYFNEPYLFNAAMGDMDDFTDTFHEFGHFMNAYAVQSDLLYGKPDSGLAELQSQGMEMLFTYWYEDVFGDEYASDMLLTTIYDMLCSIVEGAMYDEFQQRVYAEPGLTGERACELYMEVASEYGLDVGEDGKYDWVYVRHNFNYPFYYINYCVSALPALELYGLLQEDPGAAADCYMQVVSLDTEYYYLDEALYECGLPDIFDAGVYENCADLLTQSLGALV